MIHHSGISHLRIGVGGINCGAVKNVAADYHDYWQQIIIAYIREFLKGRETVYNLRNRGTLIQPVYNNLYYHNSFTYIISHVCNKLPQNIKCATTVSHFKAMLKSLMLEDIKKGCTCNRCLS